MFFNAQKLKYIHVTYSFLEKKQVVQRCSAKKVLLKFHKIHRKTPVSGVSFLKKLFKNFIKKETLVQVFSREFYRTTMVGASARSFNLL